MNYVVKEFRRHLWRTVASISGYIIASLFILLVLSITGRNEKDSFGILKGTGTHFIVYIPSNTSCCISDIANGSIFADEPTGSVDNETAEEILEHLLFLKKEKQVTLVIATHGNVHEKFADKIITIENGRINTE